jgi:Ca2+/H+ antiporter, TMEM165/GDT1 family
MAAARLFFSIFAVIFVAELPDKTTLASLVLATRHRALPVLLGACGALAAQSLIAVAAGSLLALLPERIVHIGSGVLFLVSAVTMWVRHEDDAQVKDKPEAVTFGKSLWLAFGVVFVAEWGDLTQIATAGFAARLKQPVLVFAAATTALWASRGAPPQPRPDAQDRGGSVRGGRHPADRRDLLDRVPPPRRGRDVRIARQGVISEIRRDLPHLLT